MAQFCCGCPLSFGVWVAIFLNLVQCLFYILTATMNIIFREPTVGHSSGLIAQTFNAAWCLLGLPFIFAAIWGLIYKQEANVRLYLFYMMVSYAMDVFYIVSFFVTSDVCTNIPAVLDKHGAAFACGFMRTVSLGSVLLTLIVTTYFVFTVWSYCEDLKAGGGGEGFPALLQGAGEMRIKRRQAYGDYLSFSDSFDGAGQARGGAYGKTDSMAFGTYNAPGFGEKRIFDGDYHETSFPPSRYF